MHRIARGFLALVARSETGTRLSAGDPRLRPYEIPRDPRVAAAMVPRWGDEDLAALRRRVLARLYR